MKHLGYGWVGVVFLSGMVAGCGGSSDDGRPGESLSQYQWHLKNTGQTAFSTLQGLAGMDLNVEPIFREGVVGKGVNVLVLDDGIDIKHVDLAGNVAASMLYNFDPNAANALDPTPPPADGHGTAVAGLIAATSIKNSGVRGVAPGVRLGGARYIGIDSRYSRVVDKFDAYGGAPFSRYADVFNASFAKSPTVPLDFLPGVTVESLVIEGLERLRDAKGAIFVQAAGNEYRANENDAAVCARSREVGISCSNANLDPDRTMPQVITVGALNAFGVRSSYSTAGSNLLVSAFGGEYGGPTGPAIVTTDLMGCDRGSTRRGVPPKPLNDFDDPDSKIGKALNPSCNYTSTFNGTSAAAPMVSGVVALMLGVNPNLTWRDVRFILMKTARRVDAQRKPIEVSLSSGEKYIPEPAWTRNAAGLWFDNQYGFGLVDATQAVRMAKSYNTYLKGRMASTGEDLTYEAPQDGEGLSVPIGTATGVDIPLSYQKTRVGRIEAVQLTMSMNDASMRDLAVELISPAGTRSVLMNAYNVFSEKPTKVEMFTLASNAFNEESASGTWKLRLIDTNSRRGSQPARLKGALLRVYGH
ncbi:S8 family serine peptidase [Paraburkholderia fungorum]|uniref:S8 family serine peptidase n=1 Tax=Paraburkholderia fungorum TaxID=134537 RepID=UPI0038B712BD